MTSFVSIMMKKEKLQEYCYKNPYAQLYENMIVSIDNENLLVDLEVLKEFELEFLLIKHEKICCNSCDSKVEYIDGFYYCSECDETNCVDDVTIKSFYTVNKNYILEKSYNNKMMKNVHRNPELAGGLRISMESAEPIDDSFIDIFLDEIKENNDKIHILADEQGWTLGFGQQYINIQKVDDCKLSLHGKESYLFNVIKIELAFILDAISLKQFFYVKYLPDFNKEQLIDELHDYIPNINRFVPDTRKDALENLLIAVYFLGVKSNLPDVTFYVFNAMRALESVIKLIAYKYDIKYGDKFTMFTVVSNRVDVTQETREKLGSPVKISKYKSMYELYRKDRNGYLHWDKFIGKIDNTNILRSSEDAKKIITKTLNLINEACNTL